jgi:hypothetical protein
MFIAFEGPDNTGKSTSASALAWDGEALYNATKPMHSANNLVFEEQQDLVITYDRIDWFSHMVYRLALPEHEWNDNRVRTVFAMPDTHLVVKLHHPQLAELIEDELYTSGKVAQVNPLYFYFADFFTGLNKERGYALFKTISIVEVLNNPKAGTFSQRLVSYDSPVTTWEEAEAFGVDSDEKLLELLRYEDQHRI